MKYRKSETRAVLGALFAAAGITALQLLSIGFALGKIGKLPEIAERPALPAPVVEPAPVSSEPVLLLTSRCKAGDLDTQIAWSIDE